jgi:EmrB/QacA subfamily drug resistance transporter
MASAANRADGRIAEVETSIRSRRGRWTLVAVVLASGIVFLDTSIINLAIKRMGQDLPSRLFTVLEGQAYVVNGYFLTLSALLILAGALTDYYGRRRMLLVGLLGFGLTSVLCGLAPTMDLLIAFRILQGAAGALLVPGSLAIITATFRGEDQGKAFGLWAGASAITTIIGPAIGGLLVNSISWRAAFLINVPLVVVAGYGGITHIRETRNEEASGEFDWIGAAVVVLAVGGISFGTIRGQQHGWDEPVVIGAFVVGVAAAIAFPLMMLRMRHPLVPLHLFRSRNFTITNVSTFLIYGALYVTSFFLGLFLIGTLGYDEPAAGIALIPGTVFLVLFSTQFGKLAARYGPKLFMAAGPAIMAAGVFWVGQIKSDSSSWVIGLGSGESRMPPFSYLTDVLPGWSLFGIGITVMVAPLTTCLMTSVPTRFSGIASAINNTISRVGAPLVGALVFVVIASSFYSAIASRAPEVDVASPEFRSAVAPLNPPKGEVTRDVAVAAKEASVVSFRFAMRVASGLLLAGALVNLLGIKNSPRAPA